MNLKNRLSVKIQHTSKEHLDKLEQLSETATEEKFVYLTGALEWHVKECHELMQDALIKIQELEKEVQSINKANYEAHCEAK